MTGPVYIIDLSDLHYALGSGPFTGIPRVAMAYLAALLSQPRPVYGFISYGGKFALLDRDALSVYADKLSGRTTFKPISFWQRFRGANTDLRAQSTTFLNRKACANGHIWSLQRVLTRLFPHGFVWVAVSYCNVQEDFFEALHNTQRARIAVMLHDMIPIDFPDYFEKGSDVWFSQRLKAISGQADLVIYNSDYTRQRSEFHLGRIGRAPPSIVSHLGVTPLRPDGAKLPTAIDFNRPTFVILGTIEPRKNHALLLDLWERFAAEQAAGDPRPMPQLLILGRRGWRNAALFKRLDNSPLTGVHIHEIADLSDGGVAAALCRSRALLFPSFVEGFGLPALEAALLRCPVIANDLTVYREFLGDWPAYAEVADADRWADLIRLASLDPAPARPELPMAPPTWDGHFAKVLERLAQLHLREPPLLSKEKA